MFNLLSLCALLLPVPAQTSTPQAVDFFPADTIFCLELSIEPFERLGSGTILNKLFQQSDLAEAVTPFQAELQKGMDQMSMQLGFDLPSLLMSSRFHMAWPRDIVMNHGGQLILAADLDPAIAAEINFSEMLNQSGAGAWWQSGSVLLGVINHQEFESIFEQHMSAPEGAGQMTAAQAEDLKYLKQLVQAGQENPAGGLNSVPSWKAMTKRMRSGDDLLGAWLMTETMDREFFETTIGEPIPEEVDAILPIFGIDKIRGISWSNRIAGPIFEDRMMIYGPGFGASIYPAEMLELVDLPELMKILPHDSGRAQMMAADFGAMGQILVSFIETMTELEGSPPPAEAQDVLDIVIATLEQIGPVTTANMRMEDFDRSLPGDVWVQVRDGEKLQAALSLIPEGLRDALETGMSFGPGVPMLKLSVQGNRLVLFESAAQPSTESLRTQSEYQPVATWLQKLDAKNIHWIDFVHPELLVQGLEILRSDGDDIARSLGAPDFPLKFADLPDEVVTRALMQPISMVGIADEQGLYYEMRSPFGYMESVVLISLPQMIEMMGLFGLSVVDSVDDEEF